MHKLFVIIGAFSAMFAVMLGAFGAHGLKKSLSPDMLAVYQTGVSYHLYHALAIVIIGLSLQSFNDNSLLLKWSGSLFIAGTVLFSGSLYLLSITGEKFFGPITPLGGLCFIAGWLLFGLAFVKSS